jgi:phasin
MSVGLRPRRRECIGFMEWEEAMSEQTDKMREMAQTTLDKAKEAVTKYMAESEKVREKVDSGVRSSYSNLKELNDKAVAFAEANVSAGFDLAQKLLDAKDPQEIGKIYQDHLKDQIEKMNEQFRELGSLMSKAPSVDPKK